MIRSADRTQFNSLTNRSRELTKRIDTLQNEINQKVSDANADYKEVGVGWMQ